MIEEANGVKFYSENDMILQWMRKEKREFEPETGAFIREVMASRDGAFVDVGASTGWYAVPIAVSGREVHAFEPNPPVMERLIANADLNGAKIWCHAVAASKSSGRVVFFRNPQVPLTSGGSIEAATCRNPQRIEVMSTTIDDALQSVVPALLKIDVEGHELAVLEGARGLILAHRPHMVLEANSEAHFDALDAWLAGIGGYNWVQADTRNMLCSPAY